MDFEPAYLTRRAGSAWLALSAALAFAACANPIETTDAPDATATPDSSGADADVVLDASVEADAGPAPDVGFSVRSLNLVPVGGSASSELFKVEGRLMPSSTEPSTSRRHRLRGGLLPLSP